jgi:parallel beta-helix repeat protein
MKDINKKMVWITLWLLLSTVLSPMIGASKKNNIENHRNATVNVRHLNYNLKGDILYVGGSGPGNYSSIQSAINAAREGDTIYVYNGTYCEGLEIYKEIDLLGENKNTTIIDTWSGSRPSAKIESNNVSISGFTIQKSHSRIIEIQNSNNLNLNNNIIKYKKDYYGGAEILLENTTKNTITNNNLLKTGLYFDDSYNNTIYNNHVNGKPIIYLEEQSDKTVIDAGQVILIKCDNITIRNLDISKIPVGIQLLESHNCYIINNRFNHSRYGGVELRFSHNNIIISNNFSEDKIKLDSSNYNIITDNIFHNDYGIRIRTSNNNVIKNNKITSNENGVSLYYCHNHLVTDNFFSNNEKGLYQIYSDNNTIINNTCLNNEYGIKTGSGDNHILTNNTLMSNIFGISFSSSDNNIITNNRCSDNVYGIVFSTGKNNTIKHNSFFNDGLSIHSLNNNVYNNTVNDKPIIYLEGIENKIIDYTAGQIILVECDSIVIQNQEINNTTMGIQLSYSNNCSIKNNIISNNYCSLDLCFSNHNMLKDNTFTSNAIGIDLYHSDYNILKDNICSQNNGWYGYYTHGYSYYCYGIKLYSSDKNIIERNNCSNNIIGIYVKYRSNNNTIKHNILKNCNYSIKLRSSSNDNVISYNEIYDNKIGILLDGVSFNEIINNNFLQNIKNLKLNIVIYYHWRRPVYIKGNYWDRARVSPKFFVGELTYIYADAAWGGWKNFPNWIYIDWHPAKEPYKI